MHADADADAYADANNKRNPESNAVLQHLIIVIGGIHTAAFFLNL